MKNLKTLYEDPTDYKGIFHLSIVVELKSMVTYSVTRSGDLLDFGQLLKALGNN